MLKLYCCIVSTWAVYAWPLPRILSNFEGGQCSNPEKKSDFPCGRISRKTFSLFSHSKKKGKDLLEAAIAKPSSSAVPASWNPNDATGFDAHLLGHSGLRMLVVR